MKTNWRIELPHWLLISGMVLVSFMLWGSLPDRIPVHWNMAGQADRYGGKLEGLFLLPLITLVVYLVLLFIPRIDPGRANYAQFQKAYRIIRLAITVMMTCVHAVIVCVARGVPVAINVVIPILTGGLFVVLGNVMGKIRPNWFVGIRTPWTLSSKTSWTKTHRAGGWGFTAAGILILLTGLVRPSWTLPVILVSAFGVSLGLVAYSYFVWRAAPDKTPPAGTLPA